jgi:hypothetical protein
MKQMKQMLHQRIADKQQEHKENNAEQRWTARWHLSTPLPLLINADA